MYSREEAVAASLVYFDGDNLAANVFVDKYALKDNDGNILENTPDMMHDRLAKEFARIEAKYPNPLSEAEILLSIKNFKYIVPQGSPMEGIGNNHRVTSLSNCYVIPSPEDSYGGIFKADQQEAQLMKRRGGVGMDISNIRPKGMTTNNAAKTTDGIAVFMDRFSNTCREVAQNGRRGALMLTIDVRHPEVETFINIKRDKTRVTGANISVKMSDDFMEAVKNNTTYQQKWPINSPNPSVIKDVDARYIWSQVIDAAWESAEPGILFWDNALKNTPSDIYTEEGFGSVSTNPCLVADTYVYVADGRGFVTIGDLAKEGNDVDVFCYDNENNVVIRKMRNPRVTGHNKKVYKITFDDGSSVRATDNHKFMLKSGEYVELKDLKELDQLQTITRYEETLDNKFSKSHKNKYRSKRQSYHWIKNNSIKTMEHRHIAESKYGAIDGYVIHHADFDAKNNSPDNLIKMTKEEHDNLHRENMLGDKNPMRRAATEWSKEKWTEYSKNMSAATSGILNGNCKKTVSNEDIKEGAIALTSKLGRRFSCDEWIEFAKEFDLPQTLTEYRSTEEYKNITELSFVACSELELEDQNHDTRLLQTRLDAVSNGYDAWIEDHKCFVNRTCETCGSIFIAEYVRRETGFCSSKCVAEYVAKKPGVNEQRIKYLRETYGKQTSERKNKILDEYTLLKASLGREPKEKELHAVCKTKNIPYRLRTKTGFKSYVELKETAKTHNHRIVSIIEDGIEDVYNGTVDEFHNFFFSGDPDVEKTSYSLMNGVQCGEIILSPSDSCRLISLNLLSFVSNPFTKDAWFDYKNFKSYVKMAQRLMDDMIDLELEKLDLILQKIDADNEPESVKREEKELWISIREACLNGRRTGLGITALGDTIAALGIIYGSAESIETTESIYKTLALGAHESSIDMAEERGSFPVFNYDKEKTHEYLSRVICELGPEYILKWKNFGRRNIALTTTAPTGTVSLMTQTTSGIEPCFQPVYKRRKKILAGSTDSVDHIDGNGDKWHEFEVCHHQFSEWRKISGKTNVEDSPYYKATANDVNWSASVELQAVAQKWIDHSISKTCNLPNSATKELVSEIYMKAWEVGCKGFTIYRDGCRDGVLLTGAEEKKSTFETKDAPKRPDILSCGINQVKIKNDSWTVLVGLMDDKPYEIFAGLSKFVSIPKTLTKGQLIKTKQKNSKKSSYDLKLGESDDSVIIKDIGKVFENPTEGEFTRMISLTLRHGAPVQYVVEQLQKDEESDMYSFSKVVSRVLKKYIPEGAVTSETCPSCGSKIVYIEGCKQCGSQCGWSRC